MTDAPLFPDIFIDEIKIPRESNHSKYVFSVYLKHDANMSWEELAEESGYSEKTVRNYAKKYNYRERANTYLAYKIKARAEYGIHQGNSFDANHFEMANKSTTLMKNLLNQIEEQFKDFIENIPPDQIWRYFKELQYLQRTNLEIGHTSKQALIDSLQYIMEQNESGDITDEEAQNLMRELYDEWFHKPTEEDETK